MSDMAEEFFNAWVKVMGITDFRLFCAWHVDRAWRKNLCKIKSGKDQQEKVYKLLKTLVTEKEEESFKIMYLKIMTILASGKDTQDYGEYFAKEYGKNPET